MKKGLSTGEGVVWMLRDRHGEDPGAPDRRLLVTEPEFARVLSGRELRFALTGVASGVGRRRSGNVDA